MTHDPAAVDYLLDTDHISVLQRGEGADFERLVPRVARALGGGSVLAASIVSFDEQVRGVMSRLNAKRPNLPRWYRQLGDLLTYYAGATVLPFDATAGEALERIEALKVPRRVGKMDRRIAAVALANGLPLLTSNRNDFGLVPGFMIEDWRSA